MVSFATRGPARSTASCKTQLDGAPGATYLLTAELLYLPCRAQPFQSSHRP